GAEDDALDGDGTAGADHGDGGAERFLLDQLVADQDHQAAGVECTGHLQRLPRALVLGGVEVHGHEVEGRDRLRSDASALARLAQERLDAGEIDGLVEADGQLAGMRRGSRGDGLAEIVAHRRLQARPSRRSSSSASFGPQVPARYGCGGGASALSVTRRMLPTIFQAASTSSRRVNSVWSPRMASSSSLSYASGLAAANVVP